MILLEQILAYLQGKQESCGGYTGNDITELAEFLNVTSQGLNRRLEYWVQKDKEFKQLIYLGKEKPSITLAEFFEIEQQITTDPLKVKKGIAEYWWFESQNITLPLDYSVEENRNSLSTVFAFSDLKTYGGANLEAIYERLMRAKEWFAMYQVDTMRFYPEILKKNCFLKNILNSIHPNQKLGAQAKLTFEIG